MNDDLRERARRLIRDVESSLAPGPDSAAILEALRTLSEAFDALDAHTSDVDRRLAAQQMLLHDRVLRLEGNRIFTLWTLLGQFAMAALRPVRTGRYAHVLRQLVSREAVDKIERDYAVWVAHEQSALSRVEYSRVNTRIRPKISAVMAPSNPALLATTVKSLSDQTYDNWELCVALTPENQSCASSLEHLGARARVCTVSGVETALNTAANMSTGDSLCFPVEGDSLSRFAFYYLAGALESGEYDIVYTDEDRLNASGHRTTPIFKPDWSPDLLDSCMYMGQLFVVSRDAFFGVNGFRPQSDSAQLHDLALRLSAVDAHMGHVPRVLYHAHKPSIAETNGIAAPSTAPLPFTAIICSRSPRLVRRCLTSLRETAAGIVRRIIVVMHEERGPDATLRQVVREAGAEAVSFTGVFNFSDMNNTAARLVGTPGILFLNDDVVASVPGWAEMLGGQIARDRMGIAGALLRYPSGDIQHAGIVAGIGDGVGHIGRHAQSSPLWPWLEKQRNVTAVTGACLAIRTELFESIGGFDPEFPNNYNDVDLCLRVRERGYEIVCVPVPGLVHAECQTRHGIVQFEERYRFYARWAHVLSRPDPYYSESLAPTETIALNLSGTRGFRTLLAGGRR